MQNIIVQKEKYFKFVDLFIFYNNMMVSLYLYYLAPPKFMRKKWRI